MSTRTNPCASGAAARQSRRVGFWLACAFVALLAATLALATPRAAAETAAPSAGRPTAVSPGPGESYYLYVPCDDPVNVTSTVYTSGGNTYAVLNEETIQIVLSHEDLHIYSADLTTILGFIVPGTE